jgi:uncharacterized protein
LIKDRFFRFYILILCIPAVLSAGSIPITLEVADSDRARQWGLMQRDWLPENHGMLFVYGQPRRLSVWMFNCLINLSAAFIDKNGVITEIRELKAYPEMMDPKRPVHSLEMIDQYPPDDPIVHFFRSKQITSSKKVSFVLEMEGKWFQTHGVVTGDKLIWIPGSQKATILLQNQGKKSMVFGIYRM